MIEESSGKPLVRVVTTALAFAGAYFAGTLFATILLGSGALALAFPLIVAVVCARFVWTRPGELAGGRAAFALVGALLLGGIGFCGGFFGPMILAPDANQGPLLGLFITGPGGALIGAVAGYVYGRARERRDDR
ncbi:MAG: hypothetical protein GC151_18780 [Betaproteobacteria bacterium]|nr:hypothetical protein [Betaproteobacteria bacterium]